MGKSTVVINRSDIDLSKLSSHLRGPAEPAGRKRIPRAIEEPAMGSLPGFAGLPSRHSDANEDIMVSPESLKHVLAGNVVLDFFPSPGVDIRRPGVRPKSAEARLRRGVSWTKLMSAGAIGRLARRPGGDRRIWSEADLDERRGLRDAQHCRRFPKLGIDFSVLCAIRAR